MRTRNRRCRLKPRRRAKKCLPGWRARVALGSRRSRKARRQTRRRPGWRQTGCKYRHCQHVPGERDGKFPNDPKPYWIVNGDFKNAKNRRSASSGFTTSWLGIGTTGASSTLRVSHGTWRLPRVGVRLEASLALPYTPSRRMEKLRPSLFIWMEAPKNGENLKGARAKGRTNHLQLRVLSFAFCPLPFDFVTL